MKAVDAVVGLANEGLIPESLGKMIVHLIKDELGGEINCITPVELDCILQNKKIMAIKEYRGRTNSTLIDAKHAIEKFFDVFYNNDCEDCPLK